MALTTSTFVKSGFSKFKNAVSHLSSSGDLPQGQVRTLHSYAVMSLAPNTLTEADFAAAIPDVNVGLRGAGTGAAGPSPAR